MSGRSYLCDLWFSQTLRHKNYIYYYYIYLPKTKKFGCVGRGDLTSLFFSKVAKWIEVRGTCLVTWKIRRVLLVDRQTGKNYALSLVLRKFIYENIQSIL